MNFDVFANFIALPVIVSSLSSAGIGILTENWLLAAAVGITGGLAMALLCAIDWKSEKN